MAKQSQILKKIDYKIPQEVGQILDTLQKAGFEAYLVGGCVRDILLGQEPEDWDLTTSAQPHEMDDLFEKTHYENEFGTVMVINEETEKASLKDIEVTTYRRESTYSDKRHPDKIEFGEKIEEDLKRRDFTINAMALSLPVGIKDISKGHLVDEFGGLKDLGNKKIKAVLNPNARFKEDALRIIRAIRFEAQLGFSLEIETKKAIGESRDGLKDIAIERIRDEFEKIILSDNPKMALISAKKLGILEFLIPELLEGEGVSQTDTHKYTVLEHGLRTLQTAADKGYSLEIRLAALLHDIAKPRTKREPEGKSKPTFYGHDVVGARVAHEILKRLKFPKDVIKKTTKLVRWHMFYSDTDEITHSAVRRLVRKVGKENIDDLVNLRICDRVGTGRPKEEPYRLRKYQAMIDEVMRDPLSVGELKIDGNDIMDKFHVEPGPKIGWILYALLDEVLDSPEKNEKEYLLKRAKELLNLPEEKLEELGEKGKRTLEEEEEERIKEIRDSYYVK